MRSVQPSSCIVRMDDPKIASDAPHVGRLLQRYPTCATFAQIRQGTADSDNDNATEVDIDKLHTVQTLMRE